jgi:hypothetical protein
LAGGGSELDEDAEDFSFELSEEEDDNRQEGAGEEEDEQAGGGRAVYENGHHSTDPESDSDGSERRRDRKGKALATQSNLDAQTQRLVERMQHLRMLS